MKFSSAFPTVGPLSSMFAYDSLHDEGTSIRSPTKQSAMATNSIKLLTGNSHPQLAKAVADRFVASSVVSSQHLHVSPQIGH